MTDRELLEKAAKAAGLTLTWGEKYQLGNDEIDCTDIPYAKGGSPDEMDYYWNPLTDDSDALRLAVKVGLFPSIFPSPEGCTMVTAHNKSSFDLWIEEAHGNDPYAATRRAIVRAAAAMSEE